MIEKLGKRGLLHSDKLIALAKEYFVIPTIKTFNESIL